MAKKYDIVAITGEYNGKKRYKNVGFVNESKEGYLSIKLDHLVTVDDEGKTVQWFNLFEPREQGSQGNNQAQSGPQDFDDDDDIPF